MLVAAGISIALNLALIPVFGVVGAAFAGLVANLIPVVLLYIIAQRIYPLHYDLPRALALCGASAVLLVAATLVQISDPVLDFIVRILLLFVFAALLGVTRHCREA